MQKTLPKYTVILLGIGHTNAHVLRMWKMQPLAEAELICVSDAWKSTYSGMLPGVLAGQYAVERMEIDLARLCASAGARLIVGQVTGLDLTRNCLQFADRPEIPFDVLSVGIGSIPTQEGVHVDGGRPLAIKPMQTFLPRLRQRLDELCLRSITTPVSIAVVGAGAGGTEIALCLSVRLKEWFPQRTFELTLINAGQHVVNGGLPRTTRYVCEELERRGIRLMTGRRVTEIHEGSVTLDDGECLPMDLAIWATSAAAPPLLGQLGLATDARGFLLTQADLKVVGGSPVFAVGDTGTLTQTPTPKAGVFAVRQGPVLWRNLHRLLEGKALEKYRPQRDFLTVLNLGDGTAVAQYKGMSWKGKWCWRLKDHIDTTFMAKYQDYEPMKAAPSPSDHGAQMRCTGCGGKIGGSVLSRVLARLDVPFSEHVLVGLDRPDDAAIIRPPGGRPITVTVDFFAAPLDDPYLVGRIAALNAASDIFAMGARPIAALTMATIPVGSPQRQEQLLYETLSGSLHEFRRMGATLAGGHTIEGATLTVGYTVLADQGPGPARTKGRLRPGDQLILTKPLGTGVLLAGHMQARCCAAWMSELLESMLLSNQHAAQLVHMFDIPGLTDVTGFGLAGHLLEMLTSGNLSAQLRLDDIPLLPGTAELLSQGIESTLAPANRDTEAAIRIAEQHRERAEFASLFDPQTCGGLLMGVSASDVDAVMTQLATQSHVPAAVIGEVVPARDKGERIVLA